MQFKITTSTPRRFTLGILFQKYILGYLARIVFYKTGQEKAEQETTSHKKAQSNPRNEENEKVARRAVNKWRKRKMLITVCTITLAWRGMIESLLMAYTLRPVKFRQIVPVIDDFYHHQLLTVSNVIYRTVIVYFIWQRCKKRSLNSL